MKSIFAAILLGATLARADGPATPLPAGNTNGATTNEIQIAYPEVMSFSVLPSVTDPRIKTFDEAHWIYVSRDIVVDHREGEPKDRHELLLWLPGTGGNGHGAQGFASLAAELGYHVAALMYPDSIAASVCAGDSDTNAFENFRLAIIAGGTATYQNGRKNISIARADSIENRLIKLLLRLKEIRPREHWEQFLDTNNLIKWESIAVAGQSQGSGHAALIGVKHPVERVICFGSPKDFSRKWNSPVAWYSEKSATPKERFFAFNHRQDPNSCTPEQMLENIKTLGMIGPPVDVDSEVFPYKHARVFYTSYPPVTIEGDDSPGAKTAHSAAISTKNAARWKQTWTYLLTEDTREPH